MIKLMVMEYIITLMVQCMKDSGEMIFNMVKVKNHGLMGQCMRDITWPERNMEWVFTVGTMVANTQENGMKIKLKDSEPIAGSMVVNIKVNGLIIIWMEWEFIPGLMADAIWENIKMIKNMDMVSINGPMEDFILVNG